MEVSQTVAVQVWLPARPSISRTLIIFYGHPAPLSLRKFVCTQDGRGIMSGLQVQAVHVTEEWAAGNRTGYGPMLEA